MSTIAVSSTVCGNQEVVGSNPIAIPCWELQLNWQRPLTTKDVDVDELIGSNVYSIPLMYPLSYTYYSV